MDSEETEHRKQMAKIAAAVVEDHNDALPHIYRMIGKKKLQFSDLTLLHFDSHPDMLISKDLKAEDVFVKDKLFELLSIENWIIPGVYAGHISTVIWVCPPWACQIPAGSYKFYVGKCQHSDSIRTSCSLSYFLGELLYQPEELLLNKKLLSFHVVKLEDVFQDALLIEKVLSENVGTRSLLRNGHSSSNDLILDIDLDFFSTQNPFKDVYSSKQFSQIQSLYKFSLPEDNDPSTLTKFCESRTAQLDELHAAFCAVDKNQSPVIKDPSREEIFCALVEDIKANGLASGDAVDWMWLHEVGCGVDDTELPHHVSHKQEINDMVNQVSALLKNFACPSFITIARSSDDDYCPPDQVDEIQQLVIDMLTHLYRDIDLHLDYQQAK